VALESEFEMRYLILKWAIELRALKVRIHSKLVGYRVGCYECGDASCYSCNLVHEDEDE